MCCRCGVRNVDVATVNAGPCAPPDDWETIWDRCTLVAKGLYRNRSMNLFRMGQSRRLLVCALLRKWCRVCLSILCYSCLLSAAAADDENATQPCRTIAANISIGVDVAVTALVVDRVAHILMTTLSMLCRRGLLACGFSI